MPLDGVYVCFGDGVGGVGETAKQAWCRWAAHRCAADDGQRARLRRMLGLPSEDAQCDF